MITINENTNLYGNITVKEGEVEKQVLSVNANLNKEGGNFNLNFNVIDKVALEANKADVQTQFDSFLDNLKKRMLELQYPVMIK